MYMLRTENASASSEFTTCTRLGGTISCTICTDMHRIARENHALHWNLIKLKFFFFSQNGRWLQNMALYTDHICKMVYLWRRCRVFPLFVSDKVSHQFPVSIIIMYYANLTRIFFSSFSFYFQFLLKQSSSTAGMPRPLNESTDAMSLDGLLDSVSCGSFSSPPSPANYLSEFWDFPPSQRINSNKNPLY